MTNKLKNHFKLPQKPSWVVKFMERTSQSSVILRILIIITFGISFLFNRKVLLESEIDAFAVANILRFYVMMLTGICTQWFIFSFIKIAIIRKIGAYFVVITLGMLLFMTIVGLIIITTV